MTKTPLISIIMANYNQADFIKTAIRSVFAQQYKNWELIIVDDCSTDSSIPLLHSFIGKHNLDLKVKILAQTKNRGYGYTLCNGIKNSNGSLIGILDADDALHGDKVFDTVVKYHAKYEDCALTYSDYWECRADLKKIKVFKTRQLTLKETYLQTNPNHNKNIKLRISHFKVFKRFFYELTEGINPALKRTIDKDLVLKLEEYGGLKHIPGPLYKYRVHRRGISRIKIPKEEILKINKARDAIYNTAIERRKTKLQSETWLSLDKCKRLQEKWGSYEAFGSNCRDNKKVIIKQVNKLIKGFNEKPSLLDIGCGAGHFMWVFRSKASNMIGIDYSPNMLLLVKEQFGDGLSGLQLKHATCWNTKLPSNSIDIAYQVDVCMHVGDGWKSIQEMIRVAKKYVVFTGPSFEQDLTSQIDKKFDNGKRWMISIPLLKHKLDSMVTRKAIKTYAIKPRPATDVYKHKLLVIEKW